MNSPHQVDSKINDGDGDNGANGDNSDNSDSGSDSEDYEENEWSSNTKWIFVLMFAVTILSFGSVIFNLWDATGLFYSLFFLDDGSINMTGINFNSKNASFTNQFVTDGANGYAGFSFIMFVISGILGCFVISKIYHPCQHPIKKFVTYVKDPTYLVAIGALLSVIISSGLSTTEYDDLGQYIPLFENEDVSLIRFHTFGFFCEMSTYIMFFMIMDHNVSEEIAAEFKLIRLMPGMILLMLGLNTIIEFSRNFMEFYVISNYMEGGYEWYRLNHHNTTELLKVKEIADNTIYNEYVCIAAKNILIVEILDMALHLSEYAKDYKKHTNRPPVADRILRKKRRQLRQQQNRPKNFEKCNRTCLAVLFSLFVSVQIIIAGMAYCIGHSEIITNTTNLTTNLTTPFTHHDTYLHHKNIKIETVYGINTGENAITAFYILFFVNAITLINIILARCTCFRRDREEWNQFYIAWLYVIILVLADCLPQVFFRHNGRFWWTQAINDLMTYSSQLLFFQINHSKIRSSMIWFFLLKIIVLGISFGILSNLEQEEAQEINNIEVHSFVAGVFRVILEIHIMKYIYTSITTFCTKNKINQCCSKPDE